MALVSMYCPFCLLQTQVTPAELDLRRYGVTLGKMVPAECTDRQGQPWWIGICNNPICQRPVLVYADGVKIYPTPQPAPSDDSIPEHVRRDLDEAKRCATVSAWRACAAMARRAMQAACLLKGADEGRRLFDQIDQLAARGVITKDLQAWAHEVRHLGNDGAHPPKDHTADMVEKGDAEDALELAESFLEVVFVTPARAEERRKRRTAQ